MKSFMDGPKDIQTQARPGPYVKINADKYIGNTSSIKWLKWACYDTHLKKTAKHLRARKMRI